MHVFMYFIIPDIVLRLKFSHFYCWIDPVFLSPPPPLFQVLEYQHSWQSFPPCHWSLIQIPRLVLRLLLLYQIRSKGAEVSPWDKARNLGETPDVDSLDFCTTLLPAGEHQQNPFSVSLTLLQPVRLCPFSLPPWANKMPGNCSEISLLNNLCCHQDWSKWNVGLVFPRGTWAFTAGRGQFYNNHVNLLQGNNKPSEHPDKVRF